MVTGMIPGMNGWIVVVAAAAEDVLAVVEGSTFIVFRLAREVPLCIKGTVSGHNCICSVYLFLHSQFFVLSCCLVFLFYLFFALWLCSLHMMWTFSYTGYGNEVYPVLMTFPGRVSQSQSQPVSCQSVLVNLSIHFAHKYSNNIIWVPLHQKTPIECIWLWPWTAVKNVCIWIWQCYYKMCNAMQHYLPPDQCLVNISAFQKQ